MSDEPIHRFADGPTTEASRVIDAPPSALWPLVTDIDLSRRFSTEFRGAEWLDGATGPSIGARFRGTNEHPVVGTWQTDSTIVEFEPERAIAWEVAGGGGPAATWRFTLEPVDGGTRVTQWCRLGPGESGLTPAIAARPDKEHQIIARRLEEHNQNMQRNLDGLADLV